MEPKKNRFSQKFDDWTGIKTQKKNTSKKRVKQKVGGSFFSTSWTDQSIEQVNARNCELETILERRRL